MEANYTLVVIFTVLYAITIVASVIGNALLIYIVWKTPDVRSLTSFMFVNMAVADLMVTFFTMSWSIAFFYTENKWLIGGTPGDITCRGFFYIANVAVMASILCLALMAIDRYYACVLPLKGRSAWFRKARFVTPLVWITSMVLMSVILVLYHLHDGWCTFNYAVLGLQNRETVIRGFIFYLFTISYLLPMVVITVLYAKVVRKMWFHRVPGNQLMQSQRRQKATKRRLVRMLIIIVLVFALCWLPTQCYVLYLGITAFESDEPPFVQYLVFWLGHGNSAINPWLYIRLSSNIKLAFNRIVSRRFSRTSSTRGQRSKSTRDAILNEQEAEACL